MTQVTKESLAAKIKALAEVKRYYGFMSIEQEYNLKAYRKLLQFMEGYAKLGYVIHDFEDDECEHVWLQTIESKTKQCLECGKEVALDESRN